MLLLVGSSQSRDVWRLTLVGSLTWTFYQTHRLHTWLFEVAVLTPISLSHKSSQKLNIEYNRRQEYEWTDTNYTSISNIHGTWYKYTFRLPMGRTQWQVCKKTKFYWAHKSDGKLPCPKYFVNIFAVNPAIWPKHAPKLMCYRWRYFCPQFSYSIVS